MISKNKKISNGVKHPNFKEEKKLWRKGYNFIVGLDEAGRGCERSDAEVLTNNGWRYYFDINPIKDKVLSYTNNGYIEWQKIKKVVEKDFKGNLIELKNRSIDIVVTTDHCFTVIRRVFKRDKKDNNKLKLIGYKPREERKMVTELVNNDFIPRGGKWKGINKKNFKLSKIDRNKEKFIDIKLWVAFLGIFLSEGSVSYDNKKGSYRIVISQSEGASEGRYKKIYCLLKKLPFKFTKIKTGFRCLNKQLYTYLEQFGDCYNKFIPKDVKKLSPHLLNVLINWMILGDGACYTNKNRKKICVYYTVSKKLKDDFEEILLKAGWTYHTNTRMPKDRYIGKRLIKKENQVPCFEIRLRRNNKAMVKHLHKKNVFHKGKIFCFQLPIHHNFYVRRNGTGYFTGNSLAGPVVAAAVIVRQIPVSRSVMAGQSNTNRIQVLKELRGLKDSKKLTAKKREEFYKMITKHPRIEWGMGRVSEKVIDRINILEATKLAMERAVKNLEKKLNKKPKNKPKMKVCQKSSDRTNFGILDFLLIDGNFGIKSNIPQTSIIKADEKVFSCAAASVIAKVSRDRMMLRYHRKYPQYGFDRHKGYPTKLHRKVLKKHGPLVIHRKTFYPVKKLYN